MRSAHCAPCLHDACHKLGAKSLTCRHDSLKPVRHLQDACHPVRCRGCSCSGRPALGRQCWPRQWPQRQRQLSSMSLRPLWRPSTGEAAAAHSTNAELARILTAVNSSVALCVLLFLTGVRTSRCPQLPCTVKPSACQHFIVFWAVMHTSACREKFRLQSQTMYPARVYLKSIWVHKGPHCVRLSAGGIVG